jgi:hypothetical protein
MVGMQRLLWLAVPIGAVLVMTGTAPAYLVFGPLLGLLILRIGLATFASLRAGGAHIPDGPARPVDLSAERIVYWCEGCGAELLLLARGTTIPPRHCGERMTERAEVLRQ